MKNVKKKKIYFIGIKGVGMTMLASFLKAKGNDVSGSDIKDSFMTDRVLKEAGIKVMSPFALKNIPSDADQIVYTSAALSANNLELAALKGDPRLISYAEALGALFNTYDGVAVIGSHGKTTTSAWLGYVLARSGKNPNVLVGSRVPQFKSSSLMGNSRLFVAEVDEYQDKLRYFMPKGVVLNNIEFDHPDFFKDEKAYETVFANFLKKIPKDGWLVMNMQDAASRRLRRLCRGKVMSYDLAVGNKMPQADLIAYDLRQEKGDQIFKVKGLGEFRIQLWGEHNILNALAVIAAARFLKVPTEKLKEHLYGFRGTERRAQKLGSYNGAVIIDDYAHHPTEIRATLSGLRGRYPKSRLVVVFHPHTYTRTQALFKDFAVSFKDADELIVLDIYGSAREKQGGVSSAQLSQAIQKTGKDGVKHIPTMPLVARHLKKTLKKGDVAILMGAGDVFRVFEMIKK